MSNEAKLTAPQRIMRKIASRHPSTNTLVTACLMNPEIGNRLMKMAADDPAATGTRHGAAVSDALGKAKEWLIDKEGWKDIATGAGAAGAAYGASWLIPGVRKKHLLQALIAAAAGGAGGYYGKEIRGYGQKGWDYLKGLYHGMFPEGEEIWAPNMDPNDPNYDPSNPKHHNITKV